MRISDWSSDVCSSDLFLLSIWAKTRILEYDARRQMQNKARDAFFDSIMTRKNVKQYLTLDVRRDCLVDDSLQAVSEVIGDRKSVVQGKSVSVCVDLGGRRIIRKKKNNKTKNNT